MGSTDEDDLAPTLIRKSLKCQNLLRTETPRHSKKLAMTLNLGPIGTACRHWNVGMSRQNCGNPRIARFNPRDSREPRLETKRLLANNLIVSIHAMSIPLKLQWGHALSSMECRQRKRLQLAVSSFNGAMLFRAWNASRAWGMG